MVSNMTYGGLTAPECERGLILISAPGAQHVGSTTMLSNYNFNYNAQHVGSTTMEVVRTRSPGASGYQATHATYSSSLLLLLLKSPFFKYFFLLIHDNYQSAK